MAGSFQFTTHRAEIKPDFQFFPNVPKEAQQNTIKCGNVSTEENVCKIHETKVSEISSPYQIQYDTKVSEIPSLLK